MSKPVYCSICGRMQGVGCACDVSFREKLLGVRLDPSVTPTREKRAYYDRSALDDVFGADRRERYLHETSGLGAAYSGRDGRLYRYDRDAKEVVPVGRKTEDLVYQGGETELHG